MATYTIHIPPGDYVAEAERFRLVRDGLSPWAMVFWPVWFVVKRLWLGALGVYTAWALLNVGLYALGVAPPMIALSWAAFLLLVGLEAHSVERWTLRRRGWREAGVTVAGNMTEAEERAAVALAQSGLPVLGDEPARTGWFRRSSTKASPHVPAQVLGLFPEPRR